MKESEVKDAVRTHFEGQGYFSPEKEFNIGVRPDVVAFRWISEYEIRALAVECKKTRRIRSLMETGLTQAREYQLAFPYVYLASPKLGTEVANTLSNTLNILRIGLLSVRHTSEVEEETKPNISPRLNYSKFLYRVRQRAAAILTYKEVVGEPFDLNVQDPDDVHCYRKKEVANYLINNANPEGHYYFGICIEQQKNVKQTLEKMGKKHLHKLVADLAEEYVVDLAYIDTYRPREVSWPVLIRGVRGFSEGDARWLLDYCRKKRWKIRLILCRKVWEKNEVLSRTEHKIRVERVTKELTPLRQTLTSV